MSLTYIPDCYGVKDQLVELRRAKRRPPGQFEEKRHWLGCRHGYGPNVTERRVSSCGCVSPNCAERVTCKVCLRARAARTRRELAP